MLNALLTIVDPFFFVNPRQVRERQNNCLQTVYH